MKFCDRSFLITTLTALSCLVTTCPTSAQIVPDTTLPNNSSVRTVGKTDIIENGSIAGNNLFHSFQEFSVPTGNTAYFNNSSTIENIISRVTGISASNIDGLIKTNGTANLFFLNPNGIIFGSNASLNIGGSFLASTASGIVFADGTYFSAKASQTQPLLTVSVPIGLQFGSNPGQIQVQGTGHNLSVTPAKPTPLGLQMQPGNTLALVGGNLLFEGGILTVPAGRIELGSVASEGIVSLTPASNGWILGYDGISSFGDIFLLKRTLVDGSDPSLRNFLLTKSGFLSSAIQVTGKRVQLREGSQIRAVNTAASTGGKVVINGTESVEVIGNVNNRPITSVFVTTRKGTGNAGDIHINTGRLSLQNRGIIESSSDSAGRGGNINVVAKDVEIVGRNQIEFSSLNVEAGGSGDAGNISIIADRVRVLDSGKINANGSGGSNGGNITIQTGELIVANNRARIETVAIPIQVSTTNGKSGNITITADSIILSDRVSLPNFPSGITTQSNGNGAAGNLQITTRRLTIQDGAIASATARFLGLGGKVTINASESVELSGQANSTQSPSSLTVQSLGSGKAGDLDINTNQLIIRDGAEVTVSGKGKGDAGILTVNANSIFLDNGGQITGTTASGRGGNITLQVGDLILMRNNSAISTTAQNNGDGGNIKINSPFIVGISKENSDIIANAFQGNGGRVDITTQAIYGLQFRDDPTPLSDISASSEFGLDGIVEIKTPDLDPSRGLNNLPVDVSDPSKLIAQACPSGRGIAAKPNSKFTVTGRGGLPPTPIEVLRSDRMILTDLGTNSIASDREEVNNSQALIANFHSPIIEAQGWIVDENGTVILTAEVPRGTSWFTPPSCGGS